jgi:hypothetical protein
MSAVMGRANLYPIPNGGVFSYFETDFVPFIKLAASTLIDDPAIELRLFCCFGTLKSELDPKIFHKFNYSCS